MDPDIASSDGLVALNLDEVSAPSRALASS